MKFAAPQFLWLLPLAPLAAGFFWWTWRRKQFLIAQFVQARLLNTLAAEFSQRRQKIRYALLTAAIACLALALARPQWGFKWEESKQRGLDIIVAIDTSRSMLAEDVKPNRIERAKLAALDLMKLAKNDRLALVAFAGGAFLQCPLTLDEEAFRQSVGALDVGIIPQGGSSLAEAIRTSLAAYKDASENHKILVLITDGEDHEEGAVEAAKLAAEAGMRIFTIGIGSPDGELIRVPDEKGKSSFLRDDDGNIVKSRLNETLLRQIAGAANGFYLNLRGTGTMDMLYERGLAPLPKAELNSKLMRRYFERFYLPLALAIVFLLAEMFLPDRQRDRRSQLAPLARNQALRQSVTLILLLAAPFVAAASPGSARRAYDAGKYDEAGAEYQKLLEKTPDDARLHYNLGTAAYQARQYEKAARSFNRALTSLDLILQQRAFYNSGNAWYWLGEGATEPDEKIEDWQQAVQQFDGALKLNPADADARFNRELVKKKLAELLKQQEQEQPGDQDDSKSNSDQKQKSKKKSKPKQGEGDQASAKDKDGDEKKDQKKKKSGRDKDKDKDKQEGEDKGKGEPQKGAPEEPPKDNTQTPSMVALGQMSVQQAQQLLDSQKGEERALIFKPAEKANATPRKFKDW